MSDQLRIEGHYERHMTIQVMCSHFSLITYEIIIMGG